MLHPEGEPQVPYVSQCLDNAPGPVVAASDYLKILPDSIRPYVHKPMVSLGTDGFGRSDTRAGLRDFFEVDDRHVTLAALSALARAGDLDKKVWSKAMKDLKIDGNKINPMNA